MFASSNGAGDSAGADAYSRRPVVAEVAEVAEVAGHLARWRLILA